MSDELIEEQGIDAPEGSGLESPPEEMAKPKPKAKPRKKAASLDRTKDFGVVYGNPKARYYQDGKFYNVKEELVEL